jgi:hypothetical protein
VLGVVPARGTVARELRVAEADLQIQVCKLVVQEFRAREQAVEATATLELARIHLAAAAEQVSRVKTLLTALLPVTEATALYLL